MAREYNPHPSNKELRMEAAERVKDQLLRGEIGMFTKKDGNLKGTEVIIN